MANQTSEQDIGKIPIKGSEKKTGKISGHDSCGKTWKTCMYASPCSGRNK